VESRRSLGIVAGDLFGSASSRDNLREQPLQFVARLVNAGSANGLYEPLALRLLSLRFCVGFCGPAKCARGHCCSEALAGAFVEAPRIGTDVDITVSGPTARARIAQVFRNPTEG
jgi:hypothetical protein